MAQCNRVDNGAYDLDAVTVRWAAVQCNALKPRDQWRGSLRAVSA